MMHRYFIAFLIVGISTHCTAQISDYISVGLRTQTGGATELNHILNSYNAARPWLKNELGSQTFQTGFEIGIEVIDDDFGMGILKYHLVRNTSNAKGTTPAGEDIVRKVRMRHGALEIFDFWYTPIDASRYNIGLGIMPMAIGKVRIKTKLNEGDWEQLPLTDLDKTEGGIFASFHAYSNVHLDVTDGDRFHLQVFYLMNWFKDEYDTFYVNQTLNPSSYFDHRHRTQLKVNNFGLKLSMTL